MKALKPYLVGWVSGLLTGLILMERWHRKGALHFLEPDEVEPGVELGAPTTRGVPADQPTVTAVIVAAAKADAGRARELLLRASPWGISPRGRRPAATGCATPLRSPIAAAPAVRERPLAAAPAVDQAPGGPVVGGVVVVSVAASSDHRCVQVSRRLLLLFALLGVGFGRGEIPQALGQPPDQRAQDHRDDAVDDHREQH